VLGMPGVIAKSGWVSASMDAKQSPHPKS
jgi:hypothetical protein